VIRRFPIPPGEQATLLATGELTSPLAVGELYRRKIPRLTGLPTIRIRAVRTQRLRDVGHIDALAEGFQGRRALPAFRYDWIRRHDRRWAARHTASDAELDARWRTHWAARVVYVVEFDIVAPTHNLPEQRDVLAEVARRGAQRERAGREPDAGSEYVTSGGIDRDAEAVDPGTLAALAADALERRAVAHLTATERRRARRRSRLTDFFGRSL
jgi:hypothetical protein